MEAAEAQAVLALVAMLAGPRREQAAWALAQLLDRREHLPAAEALLWTNAESSGSLSLTHARYRDKPPAPRPGLAAT